jgi:hypothetical protein
MTSDIIFSTQYFAGIEFYKISNNNNHVLIEHKENYQKRSNRNRTKVLGPNGELNLSVPLSKGKNEQTPIHQVSINYNTNWVAQHLDTLASCYGNSPYYVYYITEIKEILYRNYEFLWELNKAIDLFVRKAIDEDSAPLYTREYLTECKYDLRNTKSELYKKIQHKVFLEIRYNQVFEDKYGFVPYMSILDLLFCVGPEAVYYIKNKKVILE